MRKEWEKPEIKEIGVEETKGVREGETLFCYKCGAPHHNAGNGAGETEDRGNGLVFSHVFMHCDQRLFYVGYYPGKPPVTTS